MNKKIKTLLAAGLIAVSTFTLAGCDDGSGKAAKQSSQNQQTEQSNSENDKNENKTDDKNSDKDNKKDESKDKKSSSKHIITYYTYDINTEKLTEHTKDYNEVSVGNVIDALTSASVLPKDTKVKTAKVEEKNGVKTLVVDVNSNFVNFDQGATQETLQLQSFTNSLIKTFHVKQVLLTIEGKPYSGGHIALQEDEMLTYK